MQHPQALTEIAARKLVKPVLSRRFRKYGFKDVSVIEEEDFDGESILRMIVDVRKPVPADDLVDTIGDVRAALLERGDGRFVFLRTRLPEEELAEDVGP